LLAGYFGLGLVKMIKQWLHRWFNPHCEECHICATCEVLKETIEFERAQNAQLMKHFLKEDVVVESNESVAVGPTKANSAVPWRIRRQMLEENARANARIAREQGIEVGPSIDELENSLGVVNENQSQN
jgi:hypothetical protein